MRSILGVMGWLLLVQSGTAGVLYMKNGDQITGTIKKIWDGEVYIEPSYADEFTVDQAEIASMLADTERQFDLELEDGTTLVGSLAGADAAGNQLITVDGRTTVIPLAIIAELDEPETLYDWSANADLNSAFRTGNANNRSLTLNMDFMLKRSRHTNYLNVLFQNEQQTINDITTQIQDRERLNYNYNYSVNDPWFLGSTASFERDPVKGLNYRYNVVPSAGYNFWDDAYRELGVQLGVGYQSEKTTDVNNLSRDNAGAVGGFLLRFRYDFGAPNIEVHLTNTTTKAFFGRRNAVTQFNAGAKYEITDLLYFNTGVILDYESQPTEGATGEDLSVLFGFGVEFDK